MTQTPQWQQLGMYEMPEAQTCIAVACINFDWISIGVSQWFVLQFMLYQWFPNWEPLGVCEL